MKTRNLISRSLLGLLCLTLLACEPQAGADNASEAEKPTSTVAGVMVDSVNYMHDRGMKYTLYDVSGGEKKPVGGSIVDPLGSGGAKECCFNLPRAWHAGIKLRVEWQDSDYERTYPEVLVKELELPRYDHPADVYVVFYPKHEVEVLVSPAEPGHPEWAGRIKETPWDLCVAEHGRKVCKRAIPKAGLSLREMRGFCHIDTLEPGQCERLLNACIQDYEDEEMCTKLVWEPLEGENLEDCLKNTANGERFCRKKWGTP